MPKTLDAPVALITGASSGIGSALAEEYAARGYNLALVARRLDRLEILSTKIREKIPTCLVHCLKADVCEESEMNEAVELLVARFGRLDVVIANAGFAVFGLFDHLPNEDWSRQFQTNFFGVLNTLRPSIKYLQESRGRIGIVGSVNSYITVPGNTPYGASKFAVRGMAEGLRHELGMKKISVTLICPGFVESEIRQVDKLGKFRSEWKDFIPNWLLMPKDVAARKIARAIHGRKRERVLTAHGWWAVFVSRHFPWVIQLGFRLLRKRLLARYQKRIML